MPLRPLVPLHKILECGGQAASGVGRKVIGQIDEEVGHTGVCFQEAQVHASERQACRASQHASSAARTGAAPTQHLIHVKHRVIPSRSAR